MSKPRRCACGHAATDHAAAWADAARPCLTTWVTFGGHAACPCQTYRRAS